MHNGKQDVYVNAGSVIFFDDTISHSFKEDVLDSSLYIQLAASKKHSRFAEFDTWRQTYLTAMATFGWMVSDREFHNDPIEQNEPLELWSRIEHELGGRVPVSLVAHAKRVLMRSPERFLDNPAKALLGEYTLQSEAWQAEVNGNLSSDIPAPATPLFTVTMQLSFVHATRSMTSLFVSFKTVELVGEYPWRQVFDPDRIVGNLEVASFSAELMDLRYAHFRKPFIAALGARRSSLILELEEVA